MASKADRIIFEGVPFRRYPGSPHESDQRYYQSSKGCEVYGERYLHRAIWAKHNGPIPDDFHVHHIDGDPLNNDPANLAALPASDHLSLHGETNPWLGSDEHAAHLDSIREKAAEWHRSEEGRAWHREHGKRTWEGREPMDRTCEHCGAAYETLDRGLSRFCSNACKSAARRASGVDNEERTCEECGGTFTVNRYRKTRFCSRSCSAHYNNRVRRESSGLQPPG